MYETKTEVIYDGVKQSIPARVYGREGYDAPKLVMIYLSNKWMTPFEQSLKNIEFTQVGLLGIVCDPKLIRKMFDKPSLLNFIPKDECNWYIPVPFKTYDIGDC